MKSTRKQKQFKRKADKITSKLNDLLSEIQNQKSILENSLLSEVLQQHLKRAPTIEDFKKCQKHSRQGILDRYNFNYENTLLGMVKIIPSKEGIKFEFLPLETIF